MKNVIYPINMIKSIKILKHIFNHLINYQKLIMMNYNKFLQNKFGFTIDDYKNNAKRIKIVRFNGNGEEYLLDKYNIIYEGEYLKGKRNGKGIEYYENGRIKSKGEYLNGEIFNGIGYDEKGNEKVRYYNGIGRELYDNGLVKFEGKYLNGKKWNGKGYTYYGIKLYEIKNGKGYIREYNSDGTLLFKGNYWNGERNGEGKEYSHGKLLFEGNYLNGLRNGEGKEYYDNSRIQFEGEYLNGERRNGREYDYFFYNYKIICGGVFDYNFQTPKNKFKFINFSTLMHRFDRKEKLKEYNYGELVFKGEYVNEQRYGKGKEYFFKELIFEGEYIDGDRDGFGKEYYINKRIKFEGEYQFGKKDGKGKEYDYFGRLIFEGEYANNKRMNGLIYKYNSNDFSKYIYLIPANYFKKYENKVPSDKRKEYYRKYHIKSFGVKYYKYKSKSNNNGNGRLTTDKRNNKWKRNKKCKWSINIWR